MNSRIFNSIEILFPCFFGKACNNLPFNVAQVNYDTVREEGRKSRGKRGKIAHAFCIYFNYVKSAWIVGQLNETHGESLSLLSEAGRAIHTHTHMHCCQEQHTHSPMQKVNCCVRWECKMNLCLAIGAIALVHCSHKLCCHMSDTVRVQLSDFSRFHPPHLASSPSSPWLGETVKCRCAVCVGCNLRARNGLQHKSRLIAAGRAPNCQT